MCPAARTILCWRSLDDDPKSELYEPINVPILPRSASVTLGFASTITTLASSPSASAWTPFFRSDALVVGMSSVTPLTACSETTRPPLSSIDARAFFGALVHLGGDLFQGVVDFLFVDVQLRGEGGVALPVAPVQLLEHVVVFAEGECLIDRASRVEFPAEIGQREGPLLPRCRRGEGHGLLKLPRSPSRSPCGSLRRDVRPPMPSSPILTPGAIRSGVPSLDAYGVRAAESKAEDGERGRRRDGHLSANRGGGFGEGFGICYRHGGQLFFVSGSHKMVRARTTDQRTQTTNVQNLLECFRALPSALRRPRRRSNSDIIPRIASPSGSTAFRLRSMTGGVWIRRG